MRTGFIFLGCVLLCQFVLAQRKDSIVLSTVSVYGARESRYLAGSSVQALDSSLRANENSRHLGEVLSLQFPVYFRNYGNGMLSGISMRGTSPQHTAVLWNGINITSFSLGQADFSILPAAAFDDVSVHEGAGSARFGSGAFGGTVLLNSRSPSTNTMTVSQEAGSFGRYFTSFAAQVSTGRWGFKTRAYNLVSKNDFLILSTDQRQQHAGFRQSGVLQDIEYRFSASKTISTHYWYHDANRDIQPPVGQANSQDHQQDRNHRLSVRYLDRSRLGLLSLYGGYVNDVIVYDGSRGTVARWITGGRHEVTVAGNTHLQVGAEWNHITGWIPNYPGGEAKEDRYDFTAAAQQDIGTRLSVAINLRQPVVSGFNAPFLPYFGADYGLIKTHTRELKIRGSVSKNYRVPTLNDRYWVGAGNKNLLPETTHAGEVGLVWKSRTLELSGTAFAQRVDEWIEWVPAANGVYRPQNVKQVLAEGLEVKIGFRQTAGSWTFIPQGSYQMTRSVTTQAPASERYTVGKQLIYTPRNTASAFVQVEHRQYSGMISAQYNGIRFTDSGNSPAYALPAFAVINASAGRFWIIRDHRLDVRVLIRNLLNLDYQLYSGYALPGRNYNFQLTYLFTNKSPLK
jgi:vitamin B12 transporter